MRADHPEAGRVTMPRDVFGTQPFTMFEREPSPDIFDWLVHAATGRQPDQLVIEQVASLENGSAAMVRGAVNGTGLTLGAADNVAGTEPEMTAVPFAPPLRHDVLLLWPP